MARRARPARRSSSGDSGAPASPWIQRILPHFDPLDAVGLERIDAQVDWMLENIGVAFRDDPVALQASLVALLKTEADQASIPGPVAQRLAGAAG